MAVIGTAGHVDHGKSALVQRLTGIDPDRFEEEKRRGLTIDLGFAWLTLPSGLEVGIVDVPGHERFIRNMLAGAGGLSACLFVVAANEGWMPQSAEHLAIVDTLGIERCVVALTKADLVSQDELDAVSADISERLAVTSLQGAPIVPCSALSGEGIEDLERALDEVLAAAGPSRDEGRPRLWIDRVFTIKGAGTVVTGTLAEGSIHEGEEVLLEPQGVRSRVRSIQTHKKHVTEAGPATRVALNLAGLERTAAKRGNAVVGAEGWRSTRSVDVAVRVLPAWATGGRDHELTARGSHLMYVGSAEVPARVRLLGSTRLRANESGFARLTMRAPLPVQRGDRFVLRDAGRVLTFGGGTVLDPLPQRADPDLLAALIDADADSALEAIVSAAGRIDRSEALFRAGARDVPAGVHALGNSLYSDARWTELSTDLRRAVAEHHEEHPLESGMPVETARARLDLDEREFDAFVRKVGDIEVEEGRFIRGAGHRIALSADQERARNDLMTRLDEAGFSPPLITELDTDRSLLQSLVRSGELVRVSDFFLTRERAREARSRVRDHITSNGPATVAQLRDLLGTTRKYAVPLCEWLDATGITMRRGDVRMLGPKGRSLPE